MVVTQLPRYSPGHGQVPKLRNLDVSFPLALFCTGSNAAPQYHKPFQGTALAVGLGKKNPLESVWYLCLPEIIKHKYPFPIPTLL